MLSVANRSKLMSLIRGRGNKSTEVRLARALRAEGLVGWLRHLPLPGRPDFTFRKQKVCIFVHGCFWHGCPNCYRMPRTNTAFWATKVSGNQARDRRVKRELRAKGYRVLVVWECQLRGTRAPAIARRVLRVLKHVISPRAACRTACRRSRRPQRRSSCRDNGASVGP